MVAETYLLNMRQLDLFSALQSSTEGIDTEFKSVRGGLANTQGGTIVLGVAEKSTGLHAYHTRIRKIA